ncbi:cytochrome d ubiquinol oxidase subunit II [Streptomyces sp. 110]|uniref:Cytochrome d ubiquinol oxidase subunit II n=1 Tax=Streptomyces endocoffeicus TaxID=2898945 RepID=A0ABS1Q439_9ACTN|nr:cytochrome d ubiquinol oxidase subunit II [Streptomyces endocoffeicus]MBL1119434.1 cytochrome d ubiquinol oxidase subunit II [Streptomyces endocoffeicus]
MSEYLTYALVLLSLGAYVVLDGYDLGVGILSLLDRGERRRREYTELIATAWDANESWIILGGVALWAGLPGAYATVLPGVYPPLIAMLFAVILRGMGLEFQSASGTYRRGWGLLFGLASLAVTLCQGLVIGAVLSGLPQRGGHFTGDALAWLTPYSVLCALGLVCLYLLAGAAWLQDKTEGTAHEWAGRLGRPLLGATVVAALVLGFGLEAADPQYFHFEQPLRATLFGLAVAAAVVCSAVAWYGFGRRPDWRPFAAVLGAEAAGLLALVAATAPVVVPPSLTLHEASSPPGSQVFLVVGVGLCMPFVLAYNIYAWWVFRGKFREAGRRSPTTTAPDDGSAGPFVPPTEPRVVVIVRRTLLTLLGILLAAVSQDIFGGESAWVDPLGVALLSGTALIAWILGDRRAQRLGEYDLPGGERP